MKKPAKDASREPSDNHSTNGAAWLRAMIEASVDCVITIDAQSTILEFNAAAEQTFGYRRDDVIGKPLTETIIPPSLREAHRMGIAALLKGGTSKLLGKRVEMPAMRSDGSEFPVELTVTQIAGQTPPIFTAYLRDITDRIQAEEALHAQALRYKTLMETSTDSIYVLNEKGDLQEANAAFLSRRGYTAEEVKGLNFADWDAQWRREQLQERMRMLLGSSAMFETRHRCKDGSIFDVEVCATSVQIDGEQCVFCVTRDITERKQAVEDLRHSEQRFAAFMDNLPGFAWMKDVKGRYVYRNKPMMEIPGLRENWSGKSDADFWPPEVAAQYRASDLRVITSRAPLQTVASYPGDNRDRYVLVSKFPIFDQAGAVTMVAGVSVEVTERIQAEQARAQLAAIVESSNEAIIGQTFEGIITSWNAAAETIHGYTAAEILGRSIELLRPPEIPDLMPALRPRLKRAERIEDFETIRLRKDGSRLHVSVSLSPIKSATGEITGISGISRDITERKRIEKALESAEEQYHSIFNNAVDGIFRTSPDGKFLVANPAAARIFGFASPEELIEERQDIAQQGYVDPFRREEFKRLLQEQGVANGFEYEAYRKDRSRVWISENTHAVHSPSGEILYFEGIFEDVTERKRAEEALRESEERFRTIFEQAPLGISEGEIATARFVSANQRYADILGYTIDELRALTIKDYTHPEDLQKDLVEFQKLAAGEIRTYAMEKRYIRKDGAIIWVNLTVSPLAPPGEEPLNCMAVIEDITERKQAEEELEHSAHLLQILSRRLFQVQEDEKRHLARELHDEMGQALTAAKINLQSAQRVDNRSDLALRLDESIGILDRLLQQTRRLSFDLRPPLLDDLGLVPALRSYLDEQAQRAGFRAIFFADPHLERLSPEIETACFRVAQQALTNAVRYAEARTVNVELRLAPHALHLIVRDDGAGFDVAVAEERARRGGSLGLPGMRERLSLVGGELDCKSTPGRGTEVHAFLPLEIDSHVS